MNTSDLIIPFIRRNLGVGFVPEELALPSLKAGEIVKIRLKEEIPERQVSVVYNPHYPFPRPQRAAEGNEAGKARE
ncbi:MAG: LysR substrate-binding domain-containing protein [Christensenellaceae bacterium]